MILQLFALSTYWTCGLVNWGWRYGLVDWLIEGGLQLMREHAPITDQCPTRHCDHICGHTWTSPPHAFFFEENMAPFLSFSQFETQGVRNPDSGYKYIPRDNERVEAVTLVYNEKH